MIGASRAPFAGDKALIKVGYGCNEHCTFCHTLDVRHIDGESAEVVAKIARAKQLGHAMVVLSGGEPTIRPELFAWAERIAELGMDLGLVTNGLVLAYPDVVERLLGLRLKYVYLSLHGGSAKVHDAIVRADAFEASMRALANVSGRGLELAINCVVVRQNLPHLRELVDRVLPYADATLKFSMVQPKGGGARLFDLVTPRVADVAARVRDAIAYGEQRVAERGADGPRFAHDGVPLCLLGAHASQFDDLKTHGYRTMVEIGEPDFFPVDDVAKVHGAVCSDCALRGPCPGLYAGYAERFGDAELRPVRDVPRPSSFHWVFEALVPQPTDACPLYEDGTTPWDRARTLFVEHQGRIGRYVCRSRDFADAQLAEIKHGLGQVYLDASRKDAPDDFARDLVPLRRSARCAPCEKREACTGLFEPRMEDLFTRDDAVVRDWLGALEGDVLDVGAGTGPYAALLAARARSAALRWVCLEPDADKARALALAYPFAEVRAVECEALGDTERFDHALLLRSFNHLRDPARALGAVHRALRPGGTLLVVDDVAFGLARTAAQAQRGEQGGARLEHLRIDTAAEADARITPCGFERVERRDVSPETSTMWTLRYVRR